ncbi:hypothetical protein EKH77_04800 [Streptomyces luteoverticillatus]|uniref:Uncharacterized protein n=1 Tax=Streptomyces luteoverticillatus TaxID=66425 RepID=A0A3S9PE59_STRLT|nr:hypothetical protein EKH77_04800 [Streptomyces luteoverticillatus]
MDGVSTYLALTFGTLLSSQGTDASFVLTHSVYWGFPPGFPSVLHTLSGLFRPRFRLVHHAYTKACGHTAADPGRISSSGVPPPPRQQLSLRASVVGRNPTVQRLPGTGKSITHRTRLSRARSAHARAESSVPMT